MQIAHLWYQIRHSFWFIPSLITIVAAVLSQVTLELDETLAWEDYKGLGWIYSGSGEGASTLLSAIVGSMITATSVTFSMTLVALTLTASQYGPRLLQNFMRRPGSQIVLGTFLATFIFSLLVLRSVQVNGATAVVPHLSVTVAVGLALASVGVLIFFIHHIARAIQADTIISQVYADLIQSIDRMFPEQIGREPEGVTRPETGDQNSDEPAHVTFDKARSLVRSTSTGYIQAIDADAVLELAKEHDLLIRLDRRPGHFIIQGQVLATVYRSTKDTQVKHLDRQVCDSFILGQERSSEQDVEFAIFQLVEVALRALSPGINDPHTAIRCLDWLAGALCRLSRRNPPDPRRFDRDGGLRVIARRPTMAGLVDAAFHQIRQASAGKPALFIRLLESLESVLAQTKDEDIREALQRHAEMVWRDAERSVAEPRDRADIDRRYRGLLSKFAGQPRED